MRSFATQDRLVRWGLAAAGPVSKWRARLVIAWLARELAHRRSTLAARSLIRIAAGPPGPTPECALRTLDRMSEDPELFGEIVGAFLRPYFGTVSDRPTRVWSAVVAPLLLAPAPPGHHVPHVRLVYYLDHEPTASADRDELGVQLVRSIALSHPPRRNGLRDLLSTTDHPLILDALAVEWRKKFLPSALVAKVVVANPHIVPRDTDDVLLAVAKDRLDLVDQDRADTADALIHGTEFSNARLADKYRRALRQLGPGAARERVCKIARSRLRESKEALAAATDAGYLPADERDRAVFLYLTEQWERYDAADPDGQLIYDAWAASSDSFGPRLDYLWYEISQIARRTGRPDPADRWRATHPPSRTDPDDEPSRHRGPIGGISGAWGDAGGSVHT